MSLIIIIINYRLDNTAYLPQRIVYISCNPATFARDAAVLVGKGYRFTTAGMMNLFPQTSHVEAIGVFERAKAA